MKLDRSGDGLFEGDRPGGAHVGAEGASFTEMGNHPIGVLGDRIEAADLITQAALGAPIGVDDRFGQVVIGFGCVVVKRSQYQMEVRGIHVAVGVRLCLTELDQAGRDGGLSGSAFTAEQQELLHRQPPSGVQGRTSDTSRFARRGARRWSSPAPHMNHRAGTRESSRFFPWRRAPTD